MLVFWFSQNCFPANIVNEDNMPEIIQIIRDLPIGEGHGPIIVNEPDGEGGGSIEDNPYEGYLRKVKDAFGDTASDKLRVTIDKLADLTEHNQSGLVVGRVQSGKTANYIGLIAALQRGNAPWNVVISLTSNKINLGDQTSERFGKEFNSIKLHRASINSL